jgi:hypothetical protein
MFGGATPITTVVPSSNQPASAILALADTAELTHPATSTATTTVISQYITQPVIEREVLPLNAITREELDASLAVLRSDLLSVISNSLPKAYTIASAGPAAPVSLTTFAHSQKIDQLANVTISNATVSGVSGLTDADIPDSITASNYLPLSGGSLTFASSTLFSVFNGAYFGATATSTFTSAGWLGIGSSTPSYPLSVNGSAYLDNGNLLLGQIAPPVLNAPTATPGDSGNLNGTYYWAVTFVTATGETNVTTSVQATASPINQSVTLTDIPTSSDSDVTARKLYRTAGNPADNNLLQFVATISDNTTTTYVDNSPDGSLGDFAPFINTTGGIISINGSRIAGVSNFYTSFGSGSMPNGTGYANSAFGSLTLASNTTGLRNVALGVDALYSNTTGNRNVAAGVHALNDNLSGSDNAAFGYAALFNATSTSGLSAFGASALTDNTTGAHNSAFGYTALNFNTTGSFNTAVGYMSLQDNTSASYNSAVGNQALGNNTTGGFNSALGAFALLNNTTGEKNSSVGMWSLNANTTGYQNSALGFQTLYSNTTGYFNAAIGVSALVNNTTGHHNTALGTSALGANTTGYYNTAFGYKAGVGITSGTYNLILGANVDAPNTTGNQQLNIGNVLYGTGIYNDSVVSSSPVSGAAIGIGTTTPWRTLSVTGTVGFDGLTGSTGAGSLCLSANKEVVYNSGSDSCLSSTRATKHDITPLDLSALELVTSLQPVSFIYNNDASSTVRYGFIAEDAAAVDAHLATYDAQGAISGIDDRSIISIVVKALQELTARIESFAQTITSAVGNFGRVNTDELCVGATCISEAQLTALLTNAGNAGDTPAPSEDVAAQAPPTIAITGNNPATISVGDSYADLGATITGPTEADRNLGISYFVNGAEVSTVQIDTEEAGEHAIEYVATNDFGTATSTRTVIVGSTDAPEADEPEDVEEVVKDEVVVVEESAPEENVAPEEDVSPDEGDEEEITE